jgi:hypothetical protein
VIAACRLVATAALVVALAGCAGKASVGSSAGTADNPAPLNGASAQQLVDAITKAGLPALNAHDVTAEKCPAMHCAHGVGTDTVSVYKFSTTGQAQKFAGSTSNVYLVEDIAVVFAPSVTADLKRKYEAVVTRAAA